MPGMPIVRPRTAAVGLAAAGLAAAGVLALKPNGADAAKSLHISASPSSLKFNKTRLTAHHGKVTIVMANPSGFPHAIAVEGHGVDKDGKTVGKGGTSQVSLTLKKGTYEFYCPVDGHKAAGMKGKLVVK